MTAAGLREHDLAHFLLPTPPPSRDLRVLRLDFRGTVAHVLPQALREGACPKLEALGLVHCRLGDAGVSELAHALALATPKLRSLDLAFNGITAAGTEALARLCLGGSTSSTTTSSALEHLRLDGNPLTDAGVMCLAQVLKASAAAATRGGASKAAAGAAGAAATAAGGLIPETESSSAALSGLPLPPPLKLRTLELRRVEMGRDAVHALGQALLAGGAPRLLLLVLGTRK